MVYKQAGQSLLRQWLVAGDFTGFIIAIYTSRMGDLFFGLVLMMLTYPLYQRTQNLGFIAIIWMIIFGGLEIMIPTATLSFGKIMIMVSVGFVIFSALVKY